ncbi:MAG: hypothetical protein ACKOSO_07885 [Actinomycetota bacterium]
MPAAITRIGAETLEQPGTVQVFCRREGSTPLTLESANLTVIRVETLTQPEGSVG